MINYPWLDEYLLSKPHTVKEYKPEWDATRYMIGGKMFAMEGANKEGQPIITFKLPPSLGILLRSTYPDHITPGYYMNKEHWNSLSLSGDVPDEVVREMVDESYSLIFNALPKKLRESLK